MPTYATCDRLAYVPFYGWLPIGCRLSAAPGPLPHGSVPVSHVPPEGDTAWKLGDPAFLPGHPPTDLPGRSLVEVLQSTTDGWSEVRAVLAPSGQLQIRGGYRGPVFDPDLTVAGPRPTGATRGWIPSNWLHGAPAPVVRRLGKARPPPLRRVRSLFQPRPFDVVYEPPRVAGLAVPRFPRRG